MLKEKLPLFPRISPRKNLKLSCRSLQNSYSGDCDWFKVLKTHKIFTKNGRQFSNESGKNCNSLPSENCIKQQEIDTGYGTASMGPTSRTAHFQDQQKETSFEGHQTHPKPDGDQFGTIALSFDGYNDLKKTRKLGAIKRLSRVFREHVEKADRASQEKAQ